MSRDPRPVPVGVLISVALVGILAGGLAAKALSDSAPTAAMALVPLIGLGVYLAVRGLARGEANPSVRAAVIVLATCAACFYCLVLAGETWHPHRSRDPVVRVIQALTLLARVLVAAALPMAIAGAAAWRAAGEARHNVPPGRFAPLFVTLGLGAAAFVSSTAIFMSGLALAPPSAVAYVAVAMTLLLPLIFNAVWTYAYGRVLSRWEVDPIPESLVRGVADLRSRCGFQFDRVICLDGGYGSGRIGAVTSSPRSATLVISEPLTRLLDRQELLALLAHETAHVELRHFQRKAVFGLLATAIWFGCYVLLFTALSPVIPREFRFVEVLVTGMFVAVGRQAYETFVTRRHEREADAYAARAAGASALLGALEKLGAGRSPIRVANRWTTHSTWEIRARRLRDIAAREESVQR